MKIIFLSEWQGSPPGEVNEFLPFITEMLIDRGIAEPYIEDNKKDAEIAELKKQIAILKGRLTKQQKAAPKDKQVKSAVKTK